MNPSFMILPSLACQASCKYCFGPHYGPAMDVATAEETVRFIRTAAAECGMKKIQIIFHGGEPLLAQLPVWETLLEGLKNNPEGLPVRMSVQSNLWALNDSFVELFRRYGVSPGTSLDGPEPICDENRGKGYYARTMASIEKLEAAGLEVGAIATLTRQTLPQAEEVLAFFRDRGMSPVLHTAVRGMDSRTNQYALTPEEFGDGFIRLYPWYVKNRKYFRVPTLDRYCAGIVRGDSSVCTMQDCLGLFLAIAPTGDITTCQRMAGKPEFTLGNIFDRPTMAQLMESAPAKRLAERQRQVTERCADCPWLAICRGGCYYNAMSTGDGVIDPLCEGYKRIYSFLQKQILEEAGREENLRAMKSSPARPGENPLLRAGPYISLADRVHPSRVADHARSILGVWALGKCGSVDAAAEFMAARHYSAAGPSTRETLAFLRRELDNRQLRRNNCYLHVTFRCNLRCSHCYASAGDRPEEMPLPVLERLGEQGLAAGFRQLVITGGEPLFHADRAGLIALCGRLRGRGSNLVLRTNLTGTFTDEELLSLADAFDQVVVSIDGNEQTHDARRGAGTYRIAVENCRRYAALTAGRRKAGELSLAAVLSAAEINGEPGQSLRRLGDELHVPRVRFRPVLPLGRAAESDELPISECINQHEPVEEILRRPFLPRLSCGIGQNIYICPDGRAYPCYAWQTEHSYLGNVAELGLEAVMNGPLFTRLTGCTVDTMDRCRDCELRYLCGGACRAWGNREEVDPNTAPPQCDHLQKRIRELLRAAEEYLQPNEAAQDRT